tara:strand:- start:370 stop:1230 length:861 start_codon:yes stop_codon:yes gene_type:complete
MSSVEVSINQLPVINQVTEGDFLIIQTPNATNRLNFSDFVVGLDNTTFKNTIETNTTNIEILSANSDPVNLSPLSAAVIENTTNIETLSTQVLGLETLSGTFVETLSVINLSADNLTINGALFKGYPKYAQTIYDTVTVRAGATSATTSIDLASNITLQSLDSKVKISFTVPGSVDTNGHTAALVLQYSLDGSGWADIPEFLGEASGSSLRGTILFGGDVAGEEGHTSTFTGLYEPTVLGTNNILYIRVAIRLETGASFIQNRAQGSDTNDATGVSVILLEELFTS